MASNSLLTLVNQLQSMESALGSVMFESVAKLSSLTSSSVFLLIETDGCRRFFGAQHLREAFINAALAPNDKDIQVDVDLSMNCIQETELSQLRAASMPSMQPILAFNTFQPQTFSSPTLKSKAGPSTTNGRKRTSTADSSAPSPGKKPKAATSSSALTSSSGGMEVVVKEEGSLDLKPSILGDDDGGPSSLALAGGLDDDDDSDIEILDSMFDESSTGSGGGADSELNLSSFGAGSSTINLPPISTATGSIISQIPCNQKKVDALRSITDPMRAFQKGTIENRLFSSVFYEYGKELAKMCPFSDVKNPDTKLFFHSQMKFILSQFSNLCIQERFKFGGSVYSFSSFAKMNAMNGFKKFIDKYE